MGFLLWYSRIMVGFSIFINFGAAVSNNNLQDRVAHLFAAIYSAPVFIYLLIL